MAKTSAAGVLFSVRVAGHYLHTLGRSNPQQRQRIGQHLSGRINQRQARQAQVGFGRDKRVRVVVGMKIIRQLAQVIRDLVGLIGTCG